jgi:hypothetical protein
MKLYSIEGCVHDELTVDGKSAADLDIKKLQEITKILIDKETDTGTLIYYIQELLRNHGTIISDSVCDCCGDIIIETELEL